MAASPDANYFCLASKSCFLRLYSSRELAIRGMAKTPARVLLIKFLPGLLVCLLENGSIIVYLTEVRKPLNPNLFPQNVKEIIPLYEGNKTLGGLISTDGIVKFTSVDQLLFINQYQHQLLIGDSLGKVHSLQSNFDAFDK
jgi:hypothetical protein